MSLGRQAFGPLGDGAAGARPWPTAVTLQASGCTTDYGTASSSMALDGQLTEQLDIVWCPRQRTVPVQRSRLSFLLTTALAAACSDSAGPASYWIHVPNERSWMELGETVQFTAEGARGRSPHQGTDRAKRCSSRGRPPIPAW